MQSNSRQVVTRFAFGVRVAYEHVVDTRRVQTRRASQGFSEDEADQVVGSGVFEEPFMGPSYRRPHRRYKNRFQV